MGEKNYNRKEKKKPKQDTGTKYQPVVHGASCSCGSAPPKPPRLDWDRRVTKILARSWGTVRELWVSEAPPPGNPGVPPVSRVEEIPDLATLVRLVTGTDVELYNPVAGVRQGCLSEGAFLLHKSVNALGGAQAKIERGFLTWSGTSGYQSAFFSMKAILHLLGIVWLQAGKDTYIVDLWPPDAANQTPYPFSVIKVERIEHRELWTIFQRVLRSTTQVEDVWMPECVKGMINLEAADFARQRNEVHYRNNLWTVPADLHYMLIGTTFGIRPAGFADGEPIKNGTDDFSFVLGCVLTRMACNMLQDLTEFGGWFQQEWNLLDHWIQQDCHQMYRHGFP